MSEPKLPSPEELQKRLAEMLRSAFHEKHIPDIMPQSSGQDSSGEKMESQTSPLYQFHHTPRKIKKYLDRFVIGQDEAKKVLSIAVCDHYHHAREAANSKNSPTKNVAEYIKQNVLLIGPTGVGKTYLVKHIADLIKVPFVKADATKFSETGYVGGDVEDLVRELVNRAGGDVSLAEIGIIFLDEIDKIAGAREHTGRDVSGRGVQTALLKLMEETEVPLKNPMDMQSQIQTFMEIQRGGNVRRETINTRHILFIVSGAFEGLERIVDRRQKQSRIGFKTEAISGSEASLLSAATTRDLVDFGFEPEFIGRLPVRALCHPLQPEDLFSIMKYSEGSIIRQYERAFRAYGIQAHFDDDALREIALRSVQEKTGARGLITVLEKLLRDCKYELPDSGVAAFSVNIAFIQDPAFHLKQLLETSSAEKEHTLQEEATEFFRHFSKQHNVQLEISPPALIRLIQRALNEQVPIGKLCEKLFKDYQFGLRLIQKGKPHSKLVLEEKAIDDPEAYLSEYVVKSYHNKSQVIDNFRK